MRGPNREIIMTVPRGYNIEDIFQKIANLEDKMMDLEKEVISMDNDKEIWGYCIHYTPLDYKPYIVNKKLTLECELVERGDITQTLTCPKEIFDTVYSRLSEKLVVIKEIDRVYKDKGVI